LETKVTFRFNKRTGEVELLVDQQSNLPHAEHDLEHDRVAAEIGRVIERLPRVTEVAGGKRLPPSREAAVEAPQEQAEETSERQLPETRKEGSS